MSEVNKPELNIIAHIVNSKFLESEYQGKDWEAVRKSLIEDLSLYQDKEILKARIDELSNVGRDPLSGTARYIEERTVSLQVQLANAKDKGVKFCNCVE